MGTIDPRVRSLGACALSLLLTFASSVAYGQTTPAKPTPETPASGDEDEQKPPEEPSAAPAAPAAPPAPAPPPPEPPPKPAAPEAEEKEHTRAIFFSGDLAFTRGDLGAISDSTGFDKTSAYGVLYGLASGVRMGGFRVGVRWRVFDTTEYAMWSFAGTIGYGLPTRPLSPIFSLNLGYIYDQHIEAGLFRRSLPPGTVLPPDVDMQGVLLGFDANASYWVTEFLRLGAFIGTDIMWLSREKAPLPASIFTLPEETRNNALFTDSGSAIGFTLQVGLRGAFDIGF